MSYVLQNYNAVTYLQCLQEHSRANIFQLIYRWIPSCDFLHKQAHSDSLHAPDALTHQKIPTTYCAATIQKPLIILKKPLLCMQILHHFEMVLTQTLAVPYLKKYIPPMPVQCQHAKAFADVKHHQNIIGWNVLLRGYLSTYWKKYQNTQPTNTNNKWPTRWGISAKEIWANCNTNIHGKTKEDQLAKARATTIQKQ